MYIPAIRAVGDFGAAALLTAPTPLLVHNAGRDFPVGEIRKAYRSAVDGRRSRSPLRVSAKRLGQADLVDWMTQDS